MDLILDFLNDCEYLGLGYGPRIKILIDRLASSREHRKPVLVCASSQLADYARKQGFYVQSWRNAQDIPIFIDEVDYVTQQGWPAFGSDGLIKERKILTPLIKELCVLVSKPQLIQSFTKQTFYAEVLPQASSIVARCYLKLGATLRYTDKFTPDQHWLMEFSFQDDWDFGSTIPQLNAIAGVLDYGLGNRAVNKIFTYAPNTEICEEFKIR